MLLLLQGQHRLRPLQHLSQAAQRTTVPGLQRCQSLLQGRLRWGSHLQQQETCSSWVALSQECMQCYAKPAWLRAIGSCGADSCRQAALLSHLQ